MFDPAPTERDTGTVWDDYARQREDEYAEHRQAVYERERDRREVVPDPKPAPRVKRADRLRTTETVARSTWRDRVLERDQGCCVHANPADCADGFQAHHVVAQQELRRTYPAALWNTLSGMTVCGLAHRQHHNRVRPIRYDEIPAEVVEYLVGVGFASYLERHYP